MLQNVQYQPTPQKSLNQIRGVYCTRTQYSPAGFVNYDTLLEDALSLGCFSYWDGFSGGAVAFRKHIYGQNEPESGFRAHLIKLHGSIDWHLGLDGRVWRVRDGDIYPERSTRVLIYPQSTKYLATQRDPFAAQFDLFRRALSSNAENVLAVEVSGTTIRVELSGEVTELTRTHEGRVYPIGQIGSIVKVHFGRRLVFGFVTLLRMRSEELIEAAKPIPPDADQRVMEVELFAEGVWNAQDARLRFGRGISIYPLPRQGVYLLTRDEIVELYKSAEGQQACDGYNPLVPFAHYVGADNALCRANIDKMFGMHCAVLGSTGSGKSGAVAAILHSVLDHKTDSDTQCKPRIVIIDPHGEYGHAFQQRAVIYRAYDPIGTEETTGTSIQLPYWLMSADEFRRLVIGKTEEEATSQNNIVYKALTYARMVAADLVNPSPTSYGGTAL